MGVLCVALVTAFVVTAVMALAVPLSRRLVVHSLAVFLRRHLSGSWVLFVLNQSDPVQRALKRNLILVG